MKIVLDAMGGDFAPAAVVEGAVKASKDNNQLNLTLVGKSDMILQELEKFDYDRDRIEVVPASQVIGMDEAPATALRKKKDSSIVVGSKLVKENKASAFVSAGSTGAVMASGLFNIGRLSGIKRPAIAIPFPSSHGKTLVLDAGANVDSKPENLFQFALMGQIYAKKVMNIDNPRVGILSVGEEKKKGNQLTAATYELLEQDSRITNFIGNVEGRDIFNGSCDVVVCDGFVGNIVLKTTEGAASLMFGLLKEALTTNLLSKIGALLIKPYLKKVFAKVDYHQYGGALLLGVDGVVIISHGSSDATAIVNAIEVARETVAAEVLDIIEQEINRDGETDE